MSNVYTRNRKKTPFDVLANAEKLQDLVTLYVMNERYGSIAEGKTVKVKSSATKYATGQTIPSWVKSRKYTAQKIDGDRALLKEITSWVKISDLELA